MNQSLVRDCVCLYKLTILSFLICRTSFTLAGKMTISTDIHEILFKLLSLPQSGDLFWHEHRLQINTQTKCIHRPRKILVFQIYLVLLFF